MVVDLRGESGHGHFLELVSQDTFDPFDFDTFELVDPDQHPVLCTSLHWRQRLRDGCSPVPVACSQQQAQWSPYDDVNSPQHRLYLLERVFHLAEPPPAPSTLHPGHASQRSARIGEIKPQSKVPYSGAEIALHM